MRNVIKSILQRFINGAGEKSFVNIHLRVHRVTDSVASLFKLTSMAGYIGVQVQPLRAQVTTCVEDPLPIVRIDRD